MIKRVIVKALLGAPIAVLFLISVAFSSSPRRIENPEGASLNDFELLGSLHISDLEEEPDGRPTRNLSFTAWGTRFEVQLHPSPLFVEGARTVWVSENGTEYQSAPDTRYFEGEVAGQPGSIVRLQASGASIEAVIITEQETFFLEPANRFLSMTTPDETLAYRFSDVDSVWEHYQCGADHAESPEQILPHMGRFPTLVDPSSQLQLADYPGALLEVELQLVIDSYYSARHGAAAANRVHNLIHQVNGIFERQLGITFRIAGTRISLDPSQDGVSGITDSMMLLEQFSDSAPIGAADLAHLVTGRDLGGNVIGLSWTGALCDKPYGVGLSQDLNNSKMRLVLMAHELGHSLGASHDGSGLCSTVSAGYLMWPVVYSSASNFSACSERSIDRRFGWVSCVSPLSPDPLPAPEPVNPLNSVSTSEFVFTWEEINGADKYFIEILDEEGTKAEIIYKATVPGTQLEPQISLETGRTYKWRIAAVDSAGLGERTPWQPFCLYETRWIRGRR